MSELKVSIARRFSSAPPRDLATLEPFAPKAYDGAHPEAERDATMIEDFTHKTFTPLIGSTFRLRADESIGLSLKLTECRTLTSQYTPEAIKAGRRKPFALTFRGPLDRPIDQGTYALAHAELGGFEIFIVPIAEDDDGRLYEAVFT